MNFFLPKASQNLLGLDASDWYSLWMSLDASSCLNWARYCLRNTASFLSAGDKYSEFNGKLMSPGIAKSSSDRFVKVFTASFCVEFGDSLFRHCDMKRIP